MDISTGLVCVLIASARLCVAASISPFDDRSMHTTVSSVLHVHILEVLSHVYRQFVTAQDLSSKAGSLCRSEAPFSSRRRVVVFCHSRLLYCSYHRLIVRIRPLRMKLVGRPYVRLIRKTCCRTTCCNNEIYDVSAIFKSCRLSLHIQNYLLPALCRLFIFSKSESFMAVTSSLS